VLPRDLYKVPIKIHEIFLDLNNRLRDFDDGNIVEAPFESRYEIIDPVFEYIEGFDHKDSIPRIQMSIDRISDLLNTYDKNIDQTQSLQVFLNDESSNKYESMVNMELDFYLSELRKMLSGLKKSYIGYDRIAESSPNKVNSSQKPLKNKKSNKSKFITPANAYIYKRYKSNHFAVTETLNFLKDNGFVEKTTSAVDFKKIFRNVKPSKPIRWLTTISDLAYFIKLIHLKYKVIEKVPNNGIWKVTDMLFVDKSGNNFGWESFRGQKPPVGKTMLEIASKFLL